MLWKNCKRKLKVYLENVTNKNRKFKSLNIIWMICTTNTIDVILFFGIPDWVHDSQLESTVISILADIDVSVGHGDIEDCHRVDKADRNNFKLTFKRIINRQYCKKALVNRKKLANFNTWTKIFVSENLVLANESIAYKCCSLKHNWRIHSYFTRNDVIHWKINEESKSVKIVIYSIFNILIYIYSQYSNAGDDVLVEVAVVHLTLAHWKSFLS